MSDIRTIDLPIAAEVAGGDTMLANVGEVPVTSQVPLHRARGLSRSLLSQAEGHLLHPPTFVKYAGNPIFVRADSAFLVANGWQLYWPWVINARSILGVAAVDAFYMYYSSDHANGAGGIGVATAPHPLGPWTDYGFIYADTIEGDQTETPVVVWNADTSLFHLYTHNRSAGRNQSTALATSADGLTGWTRVGIVLDIPDMDTYGDGHTGYMRVFRLGRQWVATHLSGGGSSTNFGIAYSVDGIAWQRDTRSVQAFADQAGDGMEQRVELSSLSPFIYRGRLWGAYNTSPHVTGGNVTDKRIWAAPIEDLRLITALHPMIDAGGEGAWDEATTQWPFVLEYDGRLYLYYNSNDTTGVGAIGVAVAEAY